jgi:type II secretory pathway pseudopilin PulG
MTPRSRCQFHALPLNPGPGIHHTRARGGFTLIEALVLMVVVSIVAVGVGVGLQSSARIPETTDRALAISAELNSELENWRTVAWGNSPWPASMPYNYSDTVTLNIGGQSLSFPRTVAIAQWDPNNLATNTTPQADFVQVKVTINGQTAISYLTKPI